MSRVAVLIPCYHRPEYTKLCLQSILDAQDYEDVVFYMIDDGSKDETAELINFYANKLENPAQSVETIVNIKNENKGLRETIIDFFSVVKERKDIDLITKIDNDCMVPQNWLNDLKRILEEAKADILSPNVSQSNAAHKHGRLNRRQGDFIPSAIVGGLWFMKKEMIKGIFFERFNSHGITAAFNIIHQIVAEKSPKIGWTDAVTYGDIGHWSGTHKNHIKSRGHAIYSAEVGRPIAWQPEKDDADVSD